MCVLVTSASPLHLKQKRHEIGMTLQMCLHCPDKNMKTENTIFLIIKEKIDARAIDLEQGSACAGRRGVPALRITLL